jgi:hypothetical protein
LQDWLNGGLENGEQRNTKEKRRGGWLNVGPAVQTLQRLFAWLVDDAALDTAHCWDPRTAERKAPPNSDHTKINLTDLRMRMRNAPIAVVKSTTALSGLA